MNLENKKYEKNILADYVFCFLRNFDIASAIWVLYMVYRGLPLWQIGIVEGIFHVTSFLFEVPSGALADLLGRKKVIIIGRILYVIAAVIELFSTNMVSFSIAFMISAVSYNMNSGSEEALLYDSMKLIGREDGYLKVNSRLNVIIELASGIATFVGGVCADYSYTLCYCVVIFIAVISMIPAFLFKEPPMGERCSLKKDENRSAEKSERKLEEKNGKQNVSLKQHFSTCVKILKENPKIVKILIYYPVVNTFCTVVYFYGQQFFAEYGLRKVTISIIMLACGLVSCLGSLSSEKMMRRFGDNTKYIASVLMGLAIIVLSRNQLILSIGGFFVANFANAMLYPIQSASLNALIPSEQRATIISVNSMFFSFAMILFFPLSGFIASALDLHVAFLILGLIQLGLMVLLLKRNQGARDK